ncbi:serpin family protein [Nocardiopsis sp. NRRL B-16309]|uniref:serpin family protein n=1 Tax=Nocardiopsis sp. NRRL B-16309 TaxID=1519494 RepID=UPI0006AF8369|nr:serpin family protein [Nocardiopsis sp. NRRL B-16309]KOX10202.1 proteinase inhibitor I4 serpin [Nocardiopsis sp. NRRL B-16309]
MKSPAQPRTDHLEFAAALDRALTREGASHVWSPHSVGTVLGLLATAAAARTREELVGLLGEDVPGQLRALDEAVAGATGLDLATLNGLYVPDDLPVRADFADQVNARSGAEVESAGFRDDPDGVRERINAKVSDVTRGLIPRLLPFGSVRPDTRLLLVNALWVKMVWSEPFRASATRERTFHAPGGRRRVATMHRTGRMPYAAAAGWSMVSLEGEHDLALDVLLPDTRPPDLPPVTAEALAALYRGLRPAEVDLALPRFAVDTDSALLGPLAELGVAELATDAARFDGISEEPLRVDALLHQAVLRVDEKGAEGAAATAAVMVMAAAVPTAPVRFTVDRPFVVVLRRRGAVLFLGRVTDPDDPGPARD